MRAVLRDRYGSPSVLRVADVPVPEPTGTQVLVEVAATSVNLSDWEGLTGKPFYVRIGGLRRPKRPVLGSDIAGRVAAVGPDVTRWSVGDAVYGDNLGMLGGFAEFALAPEGVLAEKPAELSYAEASCIPQAGSIASQGTSSVRAGDRVLINGAGGGSGSLATQMAKRAGAHVTGVDNGGKLEFMKSLGADAAIDYRSDDFTKIVEKYDLILDLVAHRSVFSYLRALAPEGRYWCVGGSVRSILRIATVGAVMARLTGRSMGMLAVKPGPAHFTPVADQCVSGELEIHIDREVSLDEVPDALADVGQGRIHGKVVIVSG